MHRIAAVTFVTLVIPLAAQRTFVVDAANGPGTHFTDLPQALAQAQHRDVFVIRSGTYSPSSTDKGVALLGGSGVKIDAGAAATAPLQVVNLPAGESFAARRLELAGWSATGIVLQNCQGRVHLADLRAGAAIPTVAMTLVQVREATIADSTLAGGITADGSTLVITGSTVTGRHAGFSPARSGPALALGQSRALVAESTLRGGDGLIGFGSAQPPSPAISASWSELTLTATAPGRGLVAGGFCNGGFCSPLLGAPACTLSDAIAWHSPNVSFTTQYGTPPILRFGSAQDVQLPLPALVASGAALGGSLSATLASTPGDPIVLALAAVADPIPHPAGLLFVDVRLLVVLVQSLQGAGGAITLTIPVPNDPSLRGQTLVLQGAAFATAVQTLLFSNPAFVVFE